MATRNVTKARGEAIDYSDPEVVRARDQMAAVMREMNFKPPCECSHCLRQYRTLDQQDLIPFVYLGHVKDAVSLAKSYSRSIEVDRAFLRRKISESGLSILNRWRAGVGKRKAFLEKAKPDLYRNRNPLVDIPSRVEQLRHQREYRMGYMLPYLNVDDLSGDPTKLLGLLTHRTNCLPEEWVPFDYAMLWSGWKQCTLAEKSADGCIVMHGDQFGQWSTFDSIAVHRNDACGAPRALMILESQQTLLKFLRDLTTVILDGAKPSKSLKTPAKVISTDPATDAIAPRGLEVCTEWSQFLNADQKKDQPWLSFGAMFSNQPYSAAPAFNIDTMIDIAENQADEAQDELWLLQTDLEYFYKRSRYHEATWFDKIEKGPHRPNLTAKEKFDNIGFIMTLKVILQARDWQWLLEECQNVKRELQRSGSEIGPGKPLPKEYERALGSLEMMLRRSLPYHQLNLKRHLIRSPDFSKVFKVTGTAQQQLLGTALILELRDYTTLHRDDRIGWCLYQLTSNFDERHVFEPSAVLQYLDDFLDSCPRREAERIDQELQRCISELAAITRMMKLLDLHRPSFRLPSPDILQETRGAWQVLNKLVIMLSAEMGLGSFINPLNQFRMPTGRKDENWLARRDIAHSALKSLWAKARSIYQTMLETNGIPQECIDPQLEWMRQSGSEENAAQSDSERRMVLDRLKAARERASARKAAPQQEECRSFGTQQEVEAKDRLPQPVKTKTKTRRGHASESGSLSEDNESAVEETPPVLYKLKPASTAEKVVRLMFPDPNEDMTKEKSSADWIHFVAAMTTLGFRAEHRGGSTFEFRGEIMLPDTTLAPQKRSFTVHRPHPDTEMGPIIFQSLGRRCNRRFGWQRANFATDESGAGQGT
ncbi:hypothetical protein HO173_012117 [Letharia columbiana]|uniref:Uncharacterized protein n=1 Tax=Letharia columbiana TaxID=112416 RepID=A0A8H6CQB2_9LECA|nr:uncharacterized protein HO173_012117 [Letharia columbiana]KAF6227588.1 hypothetical protein HO173_012117 [Letharia columbiana]